MFVKLFTSMFDGTLATKGPWQAVVTFQQMLILCDRSGILDMTAEAISRRTTIPLEVIQIGIETLEKPDIDSRRPDEEGRRIVRLDPHREWGWQIVNYSYYRALRTAEERREYQRNLMRERRASAAGAGGERKTKKALVEKAQSNNDFAKFWEAYPRKENKPAAERAWRKLSPDKPLVDIIVRAVGLHAKSDAWVKDGGTFIPHPSSWLNGKRWEDDLTAMPQPQVNPLYAGPGKAVM